MSNFDEVYAHFNRRMTAAEITAGVARERAIWEAWIKTPPEDVDGILRMLQHAIPNIRGEIQSMRSDYRHVDRHERLIARAEVVNAALRTIAGLEYVLEHLEQINDEQGGAR